jgi:hypothetical protein
MRRTEVENREVAADDAAADGLALALAGAAGAVAGEGVRGIRGNECGDEEVNLLLPSLRRRRTRPLVATPWRMVRKQIEEAAQCVQ